MSAHSRARIDLDGLSLGTYLSPYTRGKNPNETSASPLRSADTPADNHENAALRPPSTKEQENALGTLSSRAVSPEADLNSAGHYLGPTSPFSVSVRPFCGTQPCH